MEAINELAAALAKAQGMIEPAPKDADNPFFHSKYASLPAIREAMRHAFTSNGLSIVQMPTVLDGQLRLRTILLHASRQSHDCGELAADVDLANPQKIGSAISYFRRYSLAAISQTVSDTDDDANAASQPQAKLTPKEQSYVADAMKEIVSCSSLDELTAIAEILKGKTPPVQNALRGAYAKKQRELKEKQDAASDPLL